MDFCKKGGTCNFNGGSCENCRYWDAQGWAEDAKKAEEAVNARLERLYARMDADPSLAAECQSGEDW